MFTAIAAFAHLRAGAAFSGWRWRFFAVIRSVKSGTFKDYAGAAADKPFYLTIAFRAFV